jgi:hypothetical protein
MQIADQRAVGLPFLGSESSSVFANSSTTWASIEVKPSVMYASDL